MSGLHICLFGSVQIALNGRPTNIQLKPIVQALLLYLLLHRHRSHRREVLIDLFWGHYDEERARRCLSTTLWRLRSELQHAVTGASYLRTTTAGEISFNTESDYWLDVAVFEENIGPRLMQPTTAMNAADAQRLEDTLQLYAGELLEGIYYDWVLRERERLRILYLKGLARLMVHYQQEGFYERSLACGQKILDKDPLREEIHREMMHLYLKTGQRAMAMRQYETCRKVLAAELRLAPMPETQVLYDRIASTAVQNPERELIATIEPDNLKQASQQLKLAIDEFDDAWKQLQHALQSVWYHTKTESSEKFYEW